MSYRALHGPLRLAPAGLALATLALLPTAARAQAAPVPAAIAPEAQTLAVADSARPVAPTALTPAVRPTAPQAAADEDLAPDRPGFTTGPSLLRRGRRQVETGYSFSRAGSERDHALGEVLVRAGVTSGVELRVGLNSFEFASGADGRASGMDDATIAAKVRLLSGGDGPSFRPDAALIAGTSLPSGGRAFGRHRAEPEATLSAAWTTPHETSLTVNLGAADRDAGAGATVAEYASGAAFAWALGARVGSYVEYSTSWTGEPGSAQRYVNTGLTFVPGHVLQIDAWTAVGVHRGGPDYSLGLGLVRRW